MKRLLTTASAIATLAMPALALAHGYQDQDQTPAQRDRAAPAEARQPAARPAQPARPAVAPPSRNQVPASQYRPQPAPQRQIMQVSPDRRQNLNRDARQDTRQRFDSRQSERQIFRRDDPNWWRGRRDFEGYEGRRYGYWYTPGYGYYRVDPRWYGFSWRIGGFVPFAFRSYYVQNIYDFGLPPAPYGYAYVYLDNNIVLMSLATGVIVQVYPNLY